MRHIFSVLCRSSSIDRDTNSLHMFDIIEQINVSEPITGPGQLAFPTMLVTLWSRDNLESPEQGRVRVTVVMPDGTRSNPIESDVDLVKYRRVRARNAFPAFPVAGVGVYEFIIEHRATDEQEWHEDHRLPVELTVKVPSPSPSPSPSPPPSEEENATKEA